MPNPPTPGQVAYAAWCAHQPQGWLHERPLPWHQLDASTQRAWEGAAEAVLDQADFPPLDLRRDEDADA